MKYDFNLDTAAVQQLPTDKRQTNNKVLLQSLFSMLGAGKSAIFTTFYNNDMKDRIWYNGQKIKLEYAINTFLGTNFRQLPDVSDSKITNLDSEPYGLLMGEDEAHSKSIGTTVGKTIGYDYTYYYPFNFQVNIPSYISSDTQTRLRLFVQKYIPQSLKFTIVTI